MLKFHISNVPWKLIALEAKGNAKNPNDITEWMSGVSSRWNELIPSIEHRSMKFNFTEYIFAPHIWLNGAHIGAKWAEKRYVFAALNLTRIAVELCAFFPSFVNINEFRWLLLPQIVCREFRHFYHKRFVAGTMTFLVLGKKLLFFFLLTWHDS